MMMLVMTILMRFDIACSEVHLYASFFKVLPKRRLGVAQEVRCAQIFHDTLKTMYHTSRSFFVNSLNLEVEVK
jgi:hypothetical protein